MADTFEFLLPVSCGVERLRKDARQLEGGVDAIHADAFNGYLLVEPSDADSMSAAEVAKSQASTGVETVLGALVVFTDQESDPPLEDRFPKIESKKPFGP